MKKIVSLIVIGLVTFFIGCSNNTNNEEVSNKENQEVGNFETVTDTEDASKNVDASNNEVTSNSEVESNDTSSNITNDTVSVESKKEDYLNRCANLEEYLRTTLADKYAGTTLDMIEASKISYENWDNLLNGIYEVLIEQLPSEQMEAVRQEETNWITERDERAKEESSKVEGGTLEPVVYNDSLAESTKERCYELINNYMK